MTKVLLFFAGLLVASICIANDTALNVGRYGPEPIGGGFKEESIIEMAREELSFEVGKETTHVDAKFYFVSHKKGADANQLVGFPDEGAAQAEAIKRSEKTGKEVMGPEAPTSGELQKLVTRIDGKEREATLQYGFVNYNWDEDSSFLWTPGTPKDGTLMAWYVVPVVFPPEKEVTVERSYDVANGGNSIGVSFFEYSTHTGAAWRGKIGSLSLTVKLKDGLTVKNLAWKGGEMPGKLQAEYGPWTSPPEDEWKVVSPTELSLRWTNFEPREQKNRREISIVFKGPKDPEG